MPTTTPTILDQISAEKTKVSERLARLDTDRATVATQLTDLETAERVLTRVSKTPRARRPTSAAKAKAGNMHRSNSAETRDRFVADSPLEEAGFELSVPSLNVAPYSSKPALG